MWIADAPPTLCFAGADWPYGPARVEVEVSLAPAGEHRCRIEAEGRVLLLDPSLPPPAGDEGPLAVEADVLRRRRPPPVVVRSRGPRPPEPGARAAIAVALDAALAGLGALATLPGAPIAPPAGPGVAWLAGHLLLFEDPLVPKGGGAAGGPPVGRSEPAPSSRGPTPGPEARPGSKGAPAPLEPGPWPRETAAPALDAAALARDARAIVAALPPVEATVEASWRERRLTEGLARAGLRARWLLGTAAGGGRLGLAIAADGRASDLEAALRERGHAPRRLTLDPAPARARVADDDHGRASA